MDFSESMKVVFQRIQKLDPENVSKIIGHLLLQNFGEQEMIRLAFSPDNTIHSLIDRAKRDLGLPLKPPISGQALTPRMKNPCFSNLPATKFTPFTPGCSSPSSAAHHQFENCENVIPMAYWDPAIIAYQPHFSSSEDHHQFETCNNNNNDNPVGAKNYCTEFARNPRPDQRSPQFCPNFMMQICEYFSQGYCKYGANCRFLHVLRMQNGYMMVLNPPNGIDQVVNGDHHGCIKQLEIELIELLKSRNGIPAPVASLAVLYREKYGRKLQAFDYYVTESSSHMQGNVGCGLSQLIAQMTNTIRLIDTPHGQPCLILTEDIPRYVKFMEERNENEAVIASLCQVYLTFPPQSMFSEQDVFNYFNHFGPVQDVRIPSQDKRMYGFVTFVFPETVTLVLTQANPHFISGTQVLVKPYRNKPMLVDSRRAEENVQSCLPDAESKPLPTATVSENAKFMEKQPIEEHGQETVEHEKKCMEAINTLSHFPAHTLHCSSRAEGSTSEGQVGRSNTSINVYNSPEEVNLPDSPFGCELVYGTSSFI